MSTPNILLLVIDSLRADAVLGSRVPTPNIDSVAAGGAIFRQCVSTTTSTTPSFSSMLTGCYPPVHGVRGLQGYRLSGDVVTMPEAFKGTGYTTYAEVTGPLVPETGILRGFDDARHRPGYRVEFMGWRDDVLARMRRYRKPWLMLLHVWEVHRPYRPPPDHIKRWDKAGYEAAVEAVDDALPPLFDALGDDTVVVITGDHGEEYPDTPFQQKIHRAARRGRARLRLGKWFPYLDKKLAGMALGHGFALWEHLVRVPLIIAGPNLPHVEIDEQVRHVDLFPTLADLCGVAVGGKMNGRSLRPLIEGRQLPEEPAYMEAVGVKLEGNRIAGARTPDWKLLKPGTGKPALYRLDGGGPPDEKRNLYSRYPEVARHLEAFLASVASQEAVAESGMTDEEEAVVERHLRDLGYL